MPYDDHGHGSHVAGIIPGNGYDSLGQQAGMAPDACLVALKVLDTNGKARSAASSPPSTGCSRTGRHNIRVVNLSVGAGVTESYLTIRSRWREAPRRSRASSSSRPPAISERTPAGNHRTAASARQAMHRGCSRSALEHERHARAAGRHDGIVQLARTDASRLGPRSPTWSRPASAPCRWRCRAARSPAECEVPRRRHDSTSSDALSEPQRNEHGRAASLRRGGADAQANPLSRRMLVKAILQYTSQN